MDEVRCNSEDFSFLGQDWIASFNTVDIFIIIPYIANDVNKSSTISVKSLPSDYSDVTTIGRTAGLSDQNDYEKLEDILQGWNILFCISGLSHENVNMLDRTYCISPFNSLSGIRKNIFMLKKWAW